MDEIDLLAELDDPGDEETDYGRGYRAALDTVLAEIQRCREEGETDLRSLRTRVEQMGASDGR
jgi:hypothetical protein